MANKRSQRHDLRACVGTTEQTRSQVFGWVIFYSLRTLRRPHTLCRIPRARAVIDYTTYFWCLTLSIYVLNSICFLGKSISMRLLFSGWARRRRQTISLVSPGEIGEAIWSSQSWQNSTIGPYLTDTEQKMLAWMSEEIMARKILMKIIDLLSACFMPTLTFLTSQWNIKNGNVRRLEQYLEAQESREDEIFGNIHGNIYEQI